MKTKNRNHKAILSAAIAALLAFASPAFAVDLSAPYNTITSSTFSSTNGQASTVTGRFDWASGYGHSVNGDFNSVFGFQNVTSSGNFGSILINGANNSIGGYGNTVFGVSNTAGNGTQACFINGLSNTVGTAAAATGILCWVGGQNNLVTGRGTLAFGTFLSDGGLFGTTLLSDYNPFSLRTAAARRTATVSDSLTAVFNNGYSLRVNDGQGANPNAGLFLIPSAANTATTSSTGFVGVNTTTPGSALEVANGSQVSTTSGVGFLAVGPTSGSHCAIDPDDIQFYSGNTPSSMFLNFYGGPVNIATGSSGGNVTIGRAGSTTTINGTFVNASDRNIKEGFASVTAKAVLDHLLTLPVSTWSYKGAVDERRHIGPMAQDFHAAFNDLLNLNSDEKTIAPLDEAGVAFTAIQGLSEVVKEKDRKIEALEERLTKLEKIMQIAK